MLRELRRAHRVTYLTLDDGGASPNALARAGEYANEVVRVPFRTRPKRSPGFYAELVANLASPLPYAVAKYRSPEMTRRLERLVAVGDVDVVVCDFLFPALNVPRALGVPTVLFQHNVEAVIWERHASVAKNPLARLYLREQWRRMRAFERAECNRFDHVVAVSAQDKATFERDYGARSVSEVPTGVDTHYFRPAGRAGRAPAELVFTGSMDWLPNEDAILWFADAILPRLERAVPGVTLTVVGRSPTPRVLALAERVPAIRVTGRVPDVRPHMERASAFVVPIRIGGGTRLKIYEAMAMELPVVSTTVGAEGLPLRDGSDVVLADDPDAFAAAVARLLTDPAAAARLGAQGAATVRAEYGWDRVAAKFADACARAAGREVPLRASPTAGAASLAG
jgi:glycosyltransferase involved in cell wall biosynthesis